MTATKTSLFECVSNEVWDSFISTSPEGSVFSLSSILHGTGVAHKKYFYELNGAIVASALIIEPGDPVFRAPFPYTLYQGVALMPLAGKRQSVVSRRLRILCGLADVLAQKFPNHTLCLHYDLADLRGFQWCNYHVPQRGKYEVSLSYTGIIYIDKFSSFDDYLLSIRDARRHDCKKAIKEGLQVEKSSNIEDFMRLYELTFLRQGMACSQTELSLIRNIVQAVLWSGQGQMLIARKIGGQSVSAIVTAQDMRSVYYLFGATDPAYRTCGANTALLLRSIQEAFDTGKKRFDMVGINSPNRGDFKTSFNAEPVPYYSLTYSTPAG